MADQQSKLPLDDIVERAIHRTVIEKKLPEKFGSRLVNWISELSLGRTDLGKKSDNERYFDVLRQSLIEKGK